MSQCECHKYIYQECDYCFAQSVRESNVYKMLYLEFEEFKKLFRKANREIDGYGKIQDDTRRKLNKIARVKGSPLS